MLHIDFETRSRVDLTKAGAYNYATNPSTEILMMSWAFDDEPVVLWLPYAQTFPQRIIDHIRANGTVKAFNAQFERLIMWYILCPDFDVPEPALEQFYCVAAQARANNMPGNLGDCARAIGGDFQKDYRGNELIKLFSIPHKDIDEFRDASTHPIEWIEFCDYCIKDTEAERDIGRYMRDLTASELDDYWVNERINDTGLMIDRDLATAAEQYADEEQRNLVELINNLTNGQVKKARGQTITRWIYENIDDNDLGDLIPNDDERYETSEGCITGNARYEFKSVSNVRPHMHVYKKGEQKLTFDKNARERLLSEPDIAPHVREVIEASDFAQASSTGKFKAMRLRADPNDDRVRGSFIFNGASATGRYSARGLQPHNMPRKGYKRDVADQIRLHMVHNSSPEDITTTSGDNIMQTMKGLLRYAMMAAPDKTFVCADLGQIEGRVNPWLSMRDDINRDGHAQAKLDVYADPNRDVYCETASEILGRLIGIDDPERQGYGKVPELSLGFGGGVGAFAGMARNYGVHLKHDIIEMIVKRWRGNNPWAQPFWYALFDAAIKAIQNPGNAYPAGRVSYLYQAEMLGGTLWCLLPSGRLLAYPRARVEWKENKFGSMAWQLSAMKAAWKPKKDETEWPRNYLWGGLLCENVTQAVAADVLRECLAHLVLKLDAPVCGHTHDEVLLEMPIADANFWAEQLHSAMVVGPKWSEGLPLAATVWIDDRYKK